MKEACTGLRFRGCSSQFFDQKTMSFNYKESFRLLKRKICKCSECEATLREISSNGGDIIDCAYWFKTWDHGEIKDGEEYKLTITAWESDGDEYSTYSYPSEFKMELVL